MAYSDIVVADAPYIYYRLEEAGGSTTPNSGSLGGTGTKGGGVTDFQPGVPNIGGQCYLFPTGLTTTFVSRASVATGTADMTWEFWYKYPGGYTANTRVLFRQQVTTTNYWEITINNSTGYLRVYDTAGGVNDGVTNTGLLDGSWHHIVITKTGGAFTFYKDGVSLGSVAGSFAAKTGTFYVSHNTSATAAGAYLDEVAYWNNRALTEAEISEHYISGSGGASTPVTVSAPVATASIDAPAPIIRRGKTITVTPMTASITAPVPLVNRKNVSATAPAMTAGVSGAPVTVATTFAQRLNAIADRGISSLADSTAGVIRFGSSASSAQAAYFKWNTPTVQPGKQIESVVIDLLGTTGANSGPFTFRIDRLTSAFTEGTYSSPTSVTYVTGQTITTDHNFYDITEIVQGWVDGSFPNHGIALTLTGSESGYLFIVDRTAAVATQQPSMIVTQVPAPQLDSENVVVGPMTVSVATPAVSVRKGVRPKVTGTMAMATTSPVPTVTAVFNPNNTIQAGPVQVNIEARSPSRAFGGSDKKVSVPAMTMGNITVNPGEVNLLTSKTNRVNNAMGMNVRLVGVFFRDQDRYLSYVPNTLSSDDMWYQMDEVSGVTALNAITFENGTHAEDALYRGGPAFRVEGPQLRPATGFDGIDDYLEIPDYGNNTLTNIMDATIEFSFRTTQLNGTLITGGGGDPQSSALFGSQMTASNQLVRLVNGELVLSNGTTTWKVRKNVADGEWHHVVISIPSLSYSLALGSVSSNKPTFVTIDGVVEFQRYGMDFFAKSMIPYTVMAYKPTFRSESSQGVSYSPNPGSATDHINGNMRDLIVRAHYAVSRETATKLYYEWSNAVITNPTPVAVGITMPAPKVKTNAKKMLAIYGLPFTDNGTDVLYTYRSIFANYNIDTISLGTSQGDVDIWSAERNFLGAIVHSPVKPFWLQGYFVYPVSIQGDNGSGAHAQSAPGLNNGEYQDSATGLYTDDKTGLMRFIDLDKDLALPITDFDALTVMNYPAVAPSASNDPVEGDLRQSGQGLTRTEWSKIRDDLRDSILSAAYRGVDLWIPEPHMAQHLGFIKGYDVHDMGRYPLQPSPTGSPSRDIFISRNLRADELDKAHTTADTFTVGTSGDYHSVYQANVFRRIVATEPGLTDIPSWEKGEYISRMKYDRFATYSDIVAYDILDKTGGLNIGDQLRIEARNGTAGTSIRTGREIGLPRWSVVSARPDGIVGKVIAREMVTYYGPEGQVIQNAYRDNALTIAAERGSVVRGRAIQGRAFMEFMDTSVEETTLAMDRFPDMWNGQRGQNKTTWSFDQRRYQPWQRNSFESEPDVIRKTYVSMNARGLRWLQRSEALPVGDAKVYVPAMELEADMVDAKPTYGRNISVTVSHMKGYLSLQQPANVDNPDVEIKAQPMEIGLSLTGLGKRITPDALNMAISMPAPQIIAGGDRIYVYLDGTRNVTLYLKEE